MDDLRRLIDWVDGLIWPSIVTWQMSPWVFHEPDPEGFPYAYHRKGADLSMRCLTASADLNDVLHSVCPPGPCGCSCHFHAQKEFAAEVARLRIEREVAPCGLCGLRKWHPTDTTAEQIYDPVTMTDARSWWPTEASKPARRERFVRVVERDLVGADY